MAKLTLAIVVFCQASSVATALPPKDEAELAGGVIEGFVSDNYDLSQCGIPIKELGDGGKEIIQGLSHFNMTKVSYGIDLIVEAIYDSVPDADARCKKVKHDVESIIGEVRKLHGPEDAIAHMVHNLLTDGVKIFGEISQMAHLIKDGAPFDAGMQMGMALRRTLVGESAPNPPNGSTPIPPAPKGSWKLVAVGAAVGLVSDDWIFLACGMGAKDVFENLPDAGKDLIQGLLHFNMTEVSDGIDLIVEAIYDAAPVAEARCKAMLHDVEATIDVIKQYHGVGDAIDHVVHNVLSDGEKIFRELSEMEGNADDHDYIHAGVQMGMALRRMLVGEPATSGKHIVV
jgi:hypothetical protein